MYAELHCHSNFSLLDGASSPEELVARAKELGLAALALTDHDEMGGVVRFAQAAAELEMPAIIGAEITADCGLRTADTLAPDAQLTHLVLLAESREGYGNLCTLITRARMEQPRGHPHVTLDQLARHSAGLFALTGCPRGWIPSLVARGETDRAVEAAATLVDIFERRVAIECWDHHLPEERAVVRGLIPIARALGLPWVVTNNVHYARPTGRITHDVLCALRHEKTLDAMGTRLRPNGEWYLKGAEQIRRRWQRNDAGIRATLAIAERCGFRLEQMHPTMPKFPLPPGVTGDEYLERLVEQGAGERWGRPGDPPTAARPFPRTPAHDKQLRHELDIIRRLDLAGYFLIVWDIVRFANREGILCQGRGSAANSAVCYALGITAIDPVRMGLLFERFLSEERKEAPDIDIDFAHNDRERVIQYVYQRYGREHAGMVCEQITWRGRSAVRDAARVLGFSVEQQNALALVSDRFSARATAELLRGENGEFDGSVKRGMGEPRMPHGREPTGAWIGTAESEVSAADCGLRAADKPATDAPTDDGVSGRKKYYHWGPNPLSTREMHQLLAPTEGTPEKISTAMDDARVAARGRHKDAAREWLTSSDRPNPNAAYEPYGSPSAQDSGSGTKRAPWLDPYASDDHVERRNPTTALRATGEGSRDTTDGKDAAGVLRRAGLDPADHRVKMLGEIVAGLHEAPRHRSIHVGGFVLTAEPLSTVVPIEPASMQDRTVIQWEKDDLDPIGLVKIDLLGLGMLTVLQECLKYIRKTRGVSIDLGQLDMTDQAVYDDLCRADTVGLFQVESRAQMNTLPRLKPRCFYDLVVEVALIRPGPIQGDMVHPYLRRKAGVEPVTYPHPSLEPILKRTLGVPLFQEQGMQVAIACAGFTPGQADNLRRAMGHKRSHERMTEICEQLIAGMRANGIDEDIAVRIYKQINAFADYGFPESHAASFALLVYASAYLKHYYAPEYTAAMLNAQPMGFYAPVTLIEDAKRHGVRVRPVNLRRSGWDCTLEPAAARYPLPATRTGSGAPNSGQRAAGSAQQNSGQRAAGSEIQPPVLRLGLRMVRGLGKKARDRLESALADGPFESVTEVVRRSGLDRRSLRSLCEAGALDAFFPDEPKDRRRRRALWEILDAERGAAGPLAPVRVRDAAEAKQAAKLPSMSSFELTEADYRMTGVSLNGHPMKHLREMMRQNGIKSAAEVARCKDGDRIGVAGLVICRQRPGTAKGFVFLTLEDEIGMINVVVTPQRFERQALLISTEPLLLVRGTLQIESGVINLKGDRFSPIRASVGAEHARRHDFH